MVVWVFILSVYQKIIGIVFYSGEDILLFGNKKQPRYALHLSVFF